MKNKNYIIAYLCALVIGILLLVYHEREALYNGVVTTIGAMIAIPSLVLLLTGIFSGRKASKSSAVKSGYAQTVKWISIIAALAGLAFGIWMMCQPAFFVKAIIYTLGAILILVGLVQVFSIYQAARPFRPSGLWFIVPVLTLAAGIIIIILGPDKVSSCAGLVTGIVLVVYSVNGFASAGREAKLASDLKAMEAEKDREEFADAKKAEKSKSEHTISSEAKHSAQ